MKTEEIRELLRHGPCSTECRLCRAAAALEAQAREIERLREIIGTAVERYRRMEDACTAAARDAHNQSWAMWEPEESGETVVGAVEEMDAVLHFLRRDFEALAPHPEETDDHE